MWIHEWPRSDAPIGFIAPLVFARHPVTGEAVTHIFSVVLTPVPVEKALRRIREEKKVWRGNQKMRTRRNADGSAADEADWLALERQEEELVAGHGEFRRSEEQTSELQSLMRNSYAVFCLKKKNKSNP